MQKKNKDKKYVKHESAYTCQLPKHWKSNLTITLSYPYTCPILWLNLLWSEIGHLHPISNPDKQCMGYFFRLHVVGFKEWSLRFDLRGAVDSGFLGEICLSLLTSGGTIDQAIWDKRCTQTGITCKGDHKQIFLCNYWPKPSTYCLFIVGLGQWVHLWLLSVIVYSVWDALYSITVYNMEWYPVADWFGKGPQFLPAATYFTIEVSGCWWPVSARSNMVISQGQYKEAQQVVPDEQYPWHAAHLHYSLFLYRYWRPAEVIMTTSQLNDTLEAYSP